MCLPAASWTDQASPPPQRSITLCCILLQLATCECRPHTCVRLVILFEDLAAITIISAPPASQEANRSLNVRSVQVIHDSALHAASAPSLLNSRRPHRDTHLGNHHGHSSRSADTVASRTTCATVANHGLGPDVKWCLGERRGDSTQATAITTPSRAVRARRLPAHRGATRPRPQGSYESSQEGREAPLARRTGRHEVLPQHPVQCCPGLEQPLHCLQ